jgi:hypothetical protein
MECSRALMGVLLMTIYLKAKAISKRKPLIDRIAFEIDVPIATAGELIAYIVKRNVDEYNNKNVDVSLFQYLTKEEVELGDKAGKIGWGDRRNEYAQDVAQALENASGCFRDGIFKLFINDEEVCFDDKISLKDNDEITFIRLTMLAGRMW